MLGFYSIRKLVEGNKLSKATVDQKTPVVRYPATGEPVTQVSWPYFWELYNLEAPEAAERSLRFLCNQFVHSYVFVPSFSETGEFRGVFVCSDRERHQCLYEVSIWAIIHLFEKVSHDYPDNVMMRFNPARRDYDVFSADTVASAEMERADRSL